MADIVDARQKIRIEIRLKMRIKQFISIHIQLILIGIEDITCSVLVQFFRTLEERIRCQTVIMVRKDNKIALRHLESRVGIAGNSEIFAQDLIPDPGILLRIFL